MNPPTTTSHRSPGLAQGLALLLLALLLAPSPLAAQEDAPQAEAREAEGPEAEGGEAQGSAENAVSEADALIERGLSLREQNQDEEAIALFERAYDMARSPRALTQLALAEQALARWVRAEMHLLAALATHDPWVQERTDVLERALATIREHLSNLEVRGGVEGAEIRVDGRTRGSLPLEGPLRVPAATVRIEVRHPGYLPFELDLPVRAGATEVIDVELAEDPNYVPPDQRIVQVIAPPEEREANAGVWIGTGMTGLGLLAGIGLGIYTGVLHESWEAHCGALTGCVPGARAEGKLMAALADASFAVMAAGGIIAILSLLLDPPWAEPEADQAPAAAPAAEGEGAEARSLPRLRLAGGPGELGLGLRMEF